VLAIQTELSRVMLEEIEGEVTNNSEIFSTAAKVSARNILAKGDIHGPMEGIFDGPMSTNAVQQKVVV
jgi:hypothetical protein